MIKLALIGIGSMGKNHYRVIKEISEFELVGICDNMAEDIYDTPIFDDIDKMLKELEFDVAIIAVPTFLHKEMAIKCLRAKKHIFIEKPISSNVQEGLEIKKEAIKQNLKVCVGHIERFNPVVTALKKELKNKQIYSIDITRVGPFPPRIADVGVLTDLAVHDIDLIKFITSSLIEKINIYKSKKIHSKFEDNAILSFHLKNDVVASITTNWLTPFRKRTIEVATKEAYYEADLMEQSLTEFSSYKQDFSYNVRKCYVKKQEPLFRELKALANFILTDDLGDLCNIDDAIRSIEIALEK